MCFSLKRMKLIEVRARFSFKICHIKKLSNFRIISSMKNHHQSQIIKINTNRMLFKKYLFLQLNEVPKKMYKILYKRFYITELFSVSFSIVNISYRTPLTHKYYLLIQLYLCELEHGHIDRWPDEQTGRQIKYVNTF